MSVFDRDIADCHVIVDAAGDQSGVRPDRAARPDPSPGLEKRKWQQSAAGSDLNVHVDVGGRRVHDGRPICRQAVQEPAPQRLSDRCELEAIIDATSFGRACCHGCDRSQVGLLNGIQ
jgi:hypothetical protein